ncbi:MAG: PLDc_N domain-containing protein, partial [Anaerotignum sp.]|nr:PLDc_N domain-containing protein [Anaerotignum sp.]
MLIAFLIIAQAAFIICLVASGSMVSRRFSRLLQIISILVVLYIVSKRDKGAYKTLWVFLILCFPIFGGPLYLLVTCQTTTRLMRRDSQNVQKKTKDLYNL